MKPDRTVTSHFFNLPIHGHDCWIEVRGRDVIHHYDNTDCNITKTSLGQLLLAQTRTIEYEPEKA